MTDREKMQLQGLVRTVRSEIMEFDKENGQWKQPFYSWEIAFNKDGSTSEMIYYNPDGSVSKTLHVYHGSGLLLRTRFQMDEGPFGETLYQYDELGRLQRVATSLAGSSREVESYHYEPDGRKTKVYHPNVSGLTGNVAYAFEGSDHSYGAQGVSAVTTLYDPRGRPVEMVFHDARHVVLLRVVALYDDRGRRVEEVQYIGDEVPFKLPAEASIEPAAQRALAEAFSPGKVMFRSRYVYDDEDRCVANTLEHELMGSLIQKTEFTYDEYGNKAFEKHSGENESYSIDETGNKIRDDRAGRSDNLHYDARYEYEYDSHHNWTQRLISLRYRLAESFEPSNMERRRLTYY